MIDPSFVDIRTKPVPISSDFNLSHHTPSSRGFTSLVTCYHCGVSSHVKARYFKLHPQLR
ncbi:unnamed protein product [Camellia sinensis]